MAHRIEQVTWGEVRAEVDRIAATMTRRDVYGVPRGGCVPAAMIAERWGTAVLDAPKRGCLIVDDLADTGRTLRRLLDQHPGCEVAALFQKPHTPALIGHQPWTEREGWLAFPWEANETGPEDAVVRLLEWVGENPERDGLLDTPRRVAKALREMTEGYGADVPGILGVQFEQDDLPYSGIVALREVPFHSMCEHHLLPFSGTASVAYIPGPSGKIVGLSKLARLVDAYARRLQVQERLTVQIVDALERHLEPLGAACIIRAHHSCMSLRGVGKDTGGMVTSEMRGVFFDDPRARAEIVGMIAPA